MQRKLAKIVEKWRRSRTNRVKNRGNAREERKKREAGSVGANQIPGRVIGDSMMLRRWWRCRRWSIGDRRLRSRTRWRQLRRSLKNLGQKVTVVCSPFIAKPGERTTYVRFYHERTSVHLDDAMNTNTHDRVHTWRYKRKRYSERSAVGCFSPGSLIIWIANSRHHEQRSVIPLLGH